MKTGLLRYDPYCLKSGMQKYIRRAFPEKAVACAYAMIENGELVELLRRLPCVVVEDCGWQKMWMLPILRQLYNERDTKPIDEIKAIIGKLVVVLSDGLKDKEPCGMHELLVAQWKRDNKPIPDMAELETLIEVKDIAAASVVVTTALKPSKGVADLPIWGVLRKKAVATGLPGAAEVIDALKWRAAQGGMGWDRETMGLVALLMVFFPEDGWVGLDTWESIVPQPDLTLKRLDWFCLDMHTQIGKIALRSLSKKMPEIPSYQFLEYAFWYMESSKVNGLIKQRWFDAWETECPHYCDGKTMDYLREWWPPIQKNCEGFINWLLKKRDLA